jgi:hypothetical protein
MNIAYLSIDNLMYEGFRSGAVITVKEYLHELKSMGHSTSIISI